MFEEKTITELKMFCDDFGIEYTKNARKKDILDVIKESDYTFEDYKNAYSDFKDFEKKEVEEIQEIIEEVPVEKDNETVLLTTIAGIGAYVWGVHFDSENPFAFVDKELAKSILEEKLNGIREASQEEYNAFQGVK